MKASKSKPKNKVDQPEIKKSKLDFFKSQKFYIPASIFLGIVVVGLAGILIMNPKIARGEFDLQSLVDMVMRHETKITDLEKKTDDTQAQTNTNTTDIKTIQGGTTGSTSGGTGGTTDGTTGSTSGGTGGTTGGGTTPTTPTAPVDPLASCPSRSWEPACWQNWYESWMAVNVTAPLKFPVSIPANPQIKYIVIPDRVYSGYKVINGVEVVTKNNNTGTVNFFLQDFLPDVKYYDVNNVRINGNYLTMFSYTFSGDHGAGNYIGNYSIGWR